MSQSILTSRRYWEQTGVRLVRTFAQAAGGTLGASATGALQADWGQALQVGFAASAIALLMSLEKLDVLPGDAEDAAVDALLARQGVAAGSPLTPLADASTTPTQTPTLTPPPPASITSTIYVPASPPPIAQGTRTGYPAPGDP